MEGKDKRMIFSENPSRGKSGRGTNPLWVIPHAEMFRYEKEGLLFIQRLS